MIRARNAALILALAALAAGCTTSQSARSTPVPTASLVATRAPSTETIPPPPRPASFEAYPATIAAYLAADPSAADACLDALFDTWAMPLLDAALGCLQANTDDDAALELLVVVSQELAPPTATSTTQYRLVVLDPADGEYAVAFQTPAYELAPPDIETLSPLVAAGDLNGDAGGEFVYHTAFCGSEGCLNTAFVYQGTAGSYELVSPRDGIGVADGTFMVEDTDGDGAREVVATGGDLGTADTGPARPRREIWAWDGAAYTLRETVAGPSPYLYHHIVDADALLAAGEYTAAEAAYLTAADNAGLLEWKPEANERAELTAYAFYRAALARLIAGGDTATAIARLDLAKTLPNTLHAQLAGSFQAGFAAKSEIGVGCAAVRDDLRANDAEYAAFWDFGTGNPAYNAAAICPF
jgi:hypothetical protein